MDQEKKKQEQNDRKTILNDVFKEMDRQSSLWGQQNHEPIVWCGILGEEVGQVNKAAIESHFMDKDLLEYRNDCVRVAAVAMSMLLCLNRKEREAHRKEAYRVHQEIANEIRNQRIELGHAIPNTKSDKRNEK